MNRELVEVLDRAVTAAFPEVAGGVLREIVRWFWDWDGASTIGTRDDAGGACAVCVRPRRDIQFFERIPGGPSREVELLCNYCHAAAIERIAAAREGRRSPSPDHALVFAIRAVRAEAPGPVAEAIVDALNRRHAVARPCEILEEFCDRCGERRFVSVAAHGLSACEACLLATS